MKERLKHRHSQVIYRGAPVEGVRPSWLLAVPEDPRRKHAVEECLHERRAEEVLPLLARERDPKGLLERRAQRRQRGQVRGLDAMAGVAGVGREEPGDVLR